MLTRRDLLMSAGASALTQPLVLHPRAAFAQTPRKVWRIGLLSLVARQFYADAGSLKLFAQGMQEHGYTEGRDYVIEARFADGDAARLPALAAELVRANIDLIVSPGTQVTLAARKATATIPIVVLLDADPVANGFAVTLARPGKNLTGFSTQFSETAVKNLELMTRLVPKLTRVAVLHNPSNAVLHQRMLIGLTLQAKQIDVQLLPFEAGSADGIELAFKAMARERVEALLVILPDNIYRTRAVHIAQLALKQRLPSTHYTLEYPEAGGLMSYGAKNIENWRLGTKFIDKIFKGAKVGEIPFEQPIHFDLTVNLKTAKALGLKVPQSILIQATKVIE